MASLCSIPPVTALHSTLLKLPNETLLQIFQYLPNSVKHSDPQADLVNLMSTCKRLVPLAREALFYAPILDSSKVDHFLATLFKYPVLPSKMHSLTIETKKIRGACMGPNPIPALDSALLSKAISHIGTLNIDQNTKQQLTKWLNTGNEFDGPQTLLILRLTMLPNLRELYLGGSILYNFPLQPLLTPSSAPSRIFDEISSHDASLSTLLSLFSRKLTVLELPTEFRTRFYNDDRYRGRVYHIPTFFPELRTLIMPSKLLYHQYPTELIPTKIRTLVLTNCKGREAEEWVVQLAEAKKTLCPDLGKVSLYHCRRAPFAELSSREVLKKAGIEFYEYIPDCYFKDGDEFYHPWLYTGIELDALEVVRHEKARRSRKVMSDEMKKREARRIAWRGPEACDPPTEA